jgi:superfamily II DNA or RNA helicase
MTKADDFIQPAKSWDDFVAGQRGRAHKEKGDAFERLVQLYLQLEPIYAAQLKNVWLLEEVPLEIRSKLNLPEPDKGIDLVAETHTSEFWAVQAKYRDDLTASISWDELSTFTGLAFGVCRNISFALICSTTERITHVLQNNERIGFCTIETWAHLDSDFFRRVEAKTLHQAAALEPYQPRDHQKIAIAAAKDHFVTKLSARGKLIMPCASGKSLTAFWIAEDLNATWILVAVPSLALIKQTLSVWMREFVARDVQPEWLCVCSDASAGEVDHDDLVTYAHDLGVPCLTNADAISDKLRNFSATRRVIFTTYQSGEVLALASRQAGIVFDFGVMDEAHKTTGRRDGMFAFLLFDENLRVKQRLFMTATERRFIGSSNQIASMEDPDIYGETFHSMSFKAALECHPPILSDYQIITIGVRESEVARLVSNNSFVKPDAGKWSVVTAQTFAGMVALQKAIQQYGIRHAVSFHSSIARASQFKHLFDQLSAVNGNGNVASFHVSGKMTTSARDSQIRAFLAASPSLLTNSKCLTEGVDVPEIDCVMFADPKTSKIDIVQACGRALRLSDGKTQGYIIVPCVVSDGATVEQVRQSVAFQFVLDVICALAAQDERIIEEFRAVSQGKQFGSRPIVSFNLNEVVAENISTENFVRAIELECWNKLARLAWRPFEEARKFAQLLGLHDMKEWIAWTRGKIPTKPKRPLDIPIAPPTVYTNEWQGWRDWLGTELLTFEESRVFARTLGLKGQFQWREYCTGRLTGFPPKPDNVPSTPEVPYRQWWKGYGDWLGTGNIAARRKPYRSFEDARAFARSLGLKSIAEWKALCSGKIPGSEPLPADIPKNPGQYYLRRGWAGWSDWLNCVLQTKMRQESAQRNLRAFRSFDEARTFARNLHFKSSLQWRAYRRGEMPHLPVHPADIPGNPPSYYRGKGWQGWGDFLGTGNIAPSDKKKFYLPFDQAREAVRKLKLKSSVEWYKFKKGLLQEKGSLPDGVPQNPAFVYKKMGWIDYQDWLGAPDKQSKRRPFEQARTWARTLGLRTAREWFAYCDGKMPDKPPRPSDIPKDVYRSYEKKGWQGIHDWLGVA